MSDEVDTPDPAVIERNTSAVEARIAAALAEHHGAFDIYRLVFVCRCGVTWPALSDDYDAEIVLHADHQASVVAALPDIAIVPRVRPCDGSDACDTNIHIHGCYADLGVCDDPHDHVTASYHSAAGGQQ